jgi:hypothetical protein
MSSLTPYTRAIYSRAISGGPVATAYAVTPAVAKAVDDRGKRIVPERLFDQHRQAIDTFIQIDKHLIAPTGRSPRQRAQQSADCDDSSKNRSARPPFQPAGF